MPTLHSLSKTYVDKTDDVATCNTNGLMVYHKNKKLLKKHIIKEFKNGKNPLHVACDYLNFDALLVITNIDNKNDYPKYLINKQDTYGCTPLMYALVDNNHKFDSYKFVNGSDDNDTTFTKHELKTIFVEELLKCGANPYIVQPRNLVCKHDTMCGFGSSALEKYLISRNAFDRPGHIMSVVNRSEQLEIVMMLLKDKKAILDVFNKKRFLRLLFKLTKCPDGDKFIYYLWENYPFLQDKIKDYLIKKGRLELIVYLYYKKIDIFTKNWEQAFNMIYRSRSSDLPTNLLKSSRKLLMLTLHIKKFRQWNRLEYFKDYPIHYKKGILTLIQCWFRKKNNYGIDLIMYIINYTRCDWFYPQEKMNTCFRRESFRHYNYPYNIVFNNALVETLY